MYTRPSLGEHWRKISMRLRRFMVSSHFQSLLASLFLFLSGSSIDIIPRWKRTKLLLPLCASSSRHPSFHRLTKLRTLSKQMCWTLGYLSVGINSSVFTTMMIAVFSQFYLRRYRATWFRKYNYLLSAGLDAVSYYLDIEMFDRYSHLSNFWTAGYSNHGLYRHIRFVRRFRKSSRYAKLGLERKALFDSHHLLFCWSTVIWLWITSLRQTSTSIIVWISINKILILGRSLFSNLSHFFSVCISIFRRLDWWTSKYRASLFP